MCEINYSNEIQGIRQQQQYLLQILITKELKLGNIFRNCEKIKNLYFVKKKIKKKFKKNKTKNIFKIQ